MPSSTSATSTNSVMTSAVKNSEMAAAATMAIDMESSIVMRRARRFSNASLIDRPAADREARDPDHADRAQRLPQSKPDGSRRKRNHDNTYRFRPLEGVLVLSRSWSWS